LFFDCSSDRLANGIVVAGMVGKSAISVNWKSAE